MAQKIRRAEYFHATVRDRPGEGYHVLSELARKGVQLLAFNAVPMGPVTVQLTLFPEDSESLMRAARSEGVVLTGPYPAFLIQGDDQPGVLAGIHGKLYDKKVNVYASTGVTDGRGGYGCVLYVRPEDFEAAANVLGC
jgi:hypothetical protein